MVKTLRKLFLAVVLAVVSLFALASCVLPGTGTQTPTTDPTKDAQTALNEFTANVTFANAEAVTTSFNLPIAGKKSGFNIPISWTSSNEAVIAVVDLMENGAPSTYYKQAKVTRPAFDQEDATVTLTAEFSLTYQKTDGTNATLKTQKTYTFVVVKETSEIAKGNLASIKEAAGKFYFEENGVAAGTSSASGLAYPVEFEATVTAVLGAEGAGQFTVSDGSAGIYVYTNKTSVKVGDKVSVKGDITVYYGTLQVGSNIDVTVLGASDQTVEFKPATPGEINAMSTADGMYGGQTLKVSGTLLYGKYNNGSSDSFWLEDAQTGSQIELYYKSFTAAEKEALQAYAGKFVEIDAVTYDTYSKSAPNDHRVFVIPSTIKEATAPELTDADKLAAAVNKVKAVSLAATYVDGQEFAFPTVDAEGAEITWAMDPATLLVDGKLVIAEAGTAKLIATIKVADLTETVELTINVAKEVKQEPAVTNKTVAELIALTTEMDAKYTVTGKVQQWGNKIETAADAATMYGNFILEGEDGSKIIVYGASATATALTFDATTGKYSYSNAKDFLENALTKDIAVGDTVKLIVVRTSYNGTPQLNAIVVSATKPGETELPTEGVVTLAQAIEIANKQDHNTYTTGKFTVTGKVSDLYNTVYGNMHLLDDAGNDLTIYGLYIEGSKYGDYTGTKPVEGDVITVTGVLGTYNGKPQMKNADLVIETKPEEPKHEHVLCATCGKCTAEDCDGTDKCAGHTTEPETPEVPGEATTVTVKIQDYAAANGWANGTMYSTLVMDSKVTVTMAAKGGSGSYDPNTGKYYTSGFEWRAYQSDKEATIVVTAADGLTITTVKITYTTKNGGILDCNGAKFESGAVVTVNAASATFAIANTGTATNGQVKVTAIEVVYGSGSGTTPEQPETPKHEHVLCATCGKCTAEDCDGTDKCAGHEVAPELPTEGVVTLAQAIEIANKQDHNTYTTGKFTVTGKVSDLYNTVYGNMHLLDDAGNDLTIYGLYIEGSKYGDYTGTKPVEGDVITVTGVLGTYNGKPQMKNADLVIETKPEEPKHEHVLCATCGKCTAEDCDGTDKCAGHEVGPHEHTEEVLPAKAASCFATGLTEGKKCSTCGEVLVAQEEVPATGEHVDTNLDITCDTEGCTKRILPAADSKISLFTAKHMIIVSLSNSYYAEGVVTEVLDAKNGVFVITDEAGDSILVRLPKNAEGTAYASWTSGKVVLGDTIQMYGKPTRNTSSTYTQEAKIESGVLTVLKHEHKFSEATCKVPATCECLAVNGEALGHGDTNGDNLCDRCQFNMSWKESYVVIATDPSANGVLAADETSWTWSNEEFDAVIAKGTSTYTIYKTAKAYMQLKKLNTLTVASKNNAKIISVTIYATNETQLTNLVNGLTGETFTKDENNLCVTVEWNKEGNFVITNNGTTTAYVSGVEVVYAPKAEEHVHTEEVLAAKEATCTETGLTEGKKCSTCGEVLVAQEEVAVKNHSFAEGKCTVCGADDPNYVAPEKPDMTLVDEFAAKIVADFNATGASDAKVTTREDFKATTHPNIKYVFNNAEKLAEYKWFFEFALAEMTAAAEASKSLSEEAFVNTKELLEKMIAGDTTAVGGDYANGRTAFRWWIQGVINGTLPPAEKDVYDMFMVDYSVAENLNRFIEAYQKSKQAAPEKPAEPVTVTLNVKDAAAANGWGSSANNLKNAYAIDENISISIAGGSNSGKFYTDHLRIYATDTPAGSITLTAKEGYKIKSVSFELVTGTYAFLQLDGATITNGQVVELDASSVLFKTVKNGNDGKQVRVKSVTVTYVAE